MKVLFAVSNDNITTSVVNKYQQNYKEIVTSKNVYYFNAIVKELQRDKSYDAIVIEEDLEPISNNNYEAIDKFLSEKLDSISDEASKPTGEDIPIIFICSDRRTKSDGLLRKLFSMSIYNALVGNDRSLNMVCALINKPRNKKDAKKYYEIETDQIEYESSKGELVSEEQIQSILMYYNKIGTNEQKCVQAFESIAKQYDNTQLRIIVKFLPMDVKAILEAYSTSYQKLMSSGTVLSNGKYTAYTPNNPKKLEKLDFVSKNVGTKPAQIKGPVVIPSNMSAKRVAEERPMQPQRAPQTAPQQQANVARPAQQPAMRPAPQNAARPQTQQRITPYSGQNVQNNQKIQYSQYNPYNAMKPPLYSPYVSQPNNPYIMNESLYNNNLQENKNASKPNFKYVNQPQQRNGQAPVAGGQVGMQPQTRPAPQPVAEPIPEPVKTVQETEQLNTTDSVEAIKTETPEVQEPVKRKRGRPRKIRPEGEEPAAPKRGRGRPRKVVAQEEAAPAVETIDTVQEPIESSVPQTEPIVPAIQDVKLPIEEPKKDLEIHDAQPPINLYDLGIDNNDTFVANDNIDLGVEPLENLISETSVDSAINTEPEKEQNLFNDSIDDLLNNNQIMDQRKENNNFELDTSTPIAGRGKIVAFVGTSKNGTSFVVNNVAQMLSQSGINTAVVDLTKNKNSYYMFTDNDANKTRTGAESLKNLSEGIVAGLTVKNNLTVFTALPDDTSADMINHRAVLENVSNTFDVVLLDCDFHTDGTYFVLAHEIYLIQSMDAFTIQPLTKFLSDLKVKNMLDENKLRVVINKYVKIKKLDYKMIVGGMSKYNEPSMTLQRDLFNPKKITTTIIPFDNQTYTKYLESIALCQLTLNGYSKDVLQGLEKLKNMVYPLVAGNRVGEDRNNSYNNYNNSYNNNNNNYNNFGENMQNEQTNSQAFSSDINNTLNKMRTNNY